MNPKRLLSERITERIGSWLFVNLQSIILIVYLLINGTTVVAGVMRPFDPFPFVFLNLMLSFQAAYTGPIVLMAQNAQARRDGKRQEQDRQILLTLQSMMDTQQVILNTLVVVLQNIQKTVDQINEEVERDR